MKILEKGARWYWVLVRCVVFSNTSKSALDKTTNIDPWASPLLYTPSFDFSLVKTNFSEWIPGKLSIILLCTLYLHEICHVFFEINKMKYSVSVTSGTNVV